MRNNLNTKRGRPVIVLINGVGTPCFDGETIATAMLAHGLSSFRTDGDGRPRGAFCNMGTCCECMVSLGTGGHRVRACLTDVRDGMKVTLDD